MEKLEKDAPVHPTRTVVWDKINQKWIETDMRTGMTIYTNIRFRLIYELLKKYRWRFWLSSQRKYEKAEKEAEEILKKNFVD